MKTVITCIVLLAAATTWSQTTIEIVLDGSQSMLRPVGVSSLFNGAVASIVAVVAEAEEQGGDPMIGLRLAGGEADESRFCSAADLVVPSGGPDGDRWAEALAAIEPVGPRPLNSSVAAAIEGISGIEGDLRIVIVTSGADECGSGPEVVAAALASADRPVDLRLVGLDLDPTSVETFGSIVLENATDADELLAALRWAILDAEKPTSTEPPPSDPTPTVPAAELTAPPQITAGEAFELTWSGPESDEDFLTLASPGSPDDEYLEWGRIEDGNPLTFRAPAAPGVYEARYVDGETGKALARIEFEVLPVPIEVLAPATVRSGLRFEVRWTGPATPGDFISIGKPGSPPYHHHDWASTTMGSPLTLAAPSKPGTYEVRYVAESGREILAHSTIEVGP